MKKIAVFLIVLFFLPFTSFALADYIDNGNGTITDTSTTLMWMQSHSYSNSWSFALTYCGDFSLAGQTDWRLPTLAELESIIEYDRSRCSIDPIFICNSTSAYWTSTESTGQPDYAWGVDFKYGNPVLIIKTSRESCRCVRAGTSPTVITNPATSVTSSSATMNGTVNPNGRSTTYYFEYGTTISYGSTTLTTSAGSATGTLSVSATIISLTEDTVYHYRLVATNSSGTSYGDDRTFGTAIIRVDPTCYSTVGEAIDNAPSIATIRIAEGDYDESVALSSSKDLTLEGGWDLAFTRRSTTSTINAITVNAGTITTGYIVVE